MTPLFYIPTGTPTKLTLNIQLKVTSEILFWKMTNICTVTNSHYSVLTALSLNIKSWMISILNSYEK